jgi:hypothetical protein
MQPHPTFPEAIAALRDSAQDSRAPAWLPDAVHALIIACLVRLLGRLDQMFQAWQSGHIPAADRHSSSRTHRRVKSRAHTHRQDSWANRIARRARLPGESSRPPSRVPPKPAAARRQRGWAKHPSHHRPAGHPPSVARALARVLARPPPTRRAPQNSPPPWPHPITPNSFR